MNNDHPLLSALRMNAVFSGFSAVFLFFAAGWVATQLGLPGAMPVYVVALLLVGFAALLAAIVRGRRIRPLEIKSIIGADLGWVVASVILVALFHDSISTAGMILVSLVALAVLVLAALQVRGLALLRSSKSKEQPAERAEAV